MEVNDNPGGANARLAALSAGGSHAGHTFSRRRFLRGAAGTLSALPLVGLTSCGGGGSGTSAAGSTYTGAFASANYTSIIDTVPLLVAQSKGYFNDEGLKLTPQEFQQGPDAVRAIASAQAGLGESAVFGGVAAYGAGLTELRLVGTILQTLNPVFIVKTDSTIQSAKDLRGKKIGVQANTSLIQYLLVDMLKSAGLTLADVDAINTNSVAKTVTAVQNGVVDCGFSTPPLATKLVISGQLRIIYDSGKSAPPLTEAALFTNKQFLDEHGDVVERYIDGCAQAQQFIRTHPQDAAPIYARAANIEDALAVTIVQQYASGYVIGIRRDGIELNIQAAKSLGILKQDIPYDQFVDDRYARAAAKKWA